MAFFTKIIQKPFFQRLIIKFANRRSLSNAIDPYVSKISVTSELEKLFEQFSSSEYSSYSHHKEKFQSYARRISESIHRGDIQLLSVYVLVRDLGTPEQLSHFNLLFPNVIDKDVEIKFNIPRFNLMSSSMILLGRSYCSKLSQDYFEHLRRVDLLKKFLFEQTQVDSKFKAEIYKPFMLDNDPLSFVTPIENISQLKRKQKQSTPLMRLLKNRELKIAK